jgi:hypothetical protein
MDQCAGKRVALVWYSFHLRGQALSLLSLWSQTSTIT